MRSANTWSLRSLPLTDAEFNSLINHSVVATLLGQQLDEGECEAIALFIELNAELLLIDERRGRAEADRLGLRITGY